MLTQISLARDEAQRITALSGIRHSNRHRYRTVNTIGTTYFLSIVTADVLLDTLYLCTRLYTDPAHVRSLRYTAVFLVFHIYTHFILMRFTARWDNVKRSRTLNYQLPSHASGPWRSCHDCGRTCPPRSHHCPVCRGCILKRDHHCFITGVCIGYHNQRHFIILAFYSVIGGTVFIFHLYDYFLLQDLDMMSRDIYKLFLPVTVIKYFTRSIGSDVLFLAVILYLTFGCVFAAFLSLCQQAYLVLRGQTAYELKSGRKEYSQGVWINIVSVFGKFGFLQFVFPVPVPYHSDGYSWKHQYKFRLGP